MMVLTHKIKEISYCTGNSQFLLANTKKDLLAIIVNEGNHGNANSTFNQLFRPLFSTNDSLNTLQVYLFEGDDCNKVVNNARKFAVGRVCNNRTRAQEDSTKQYPLNSVLELSSPKTIVK
jgi:hypothetical protein